MQLISSILKASCALRSIAFASSCMSGMFLRPAADFGPFSTNVNHLMEQSSVILSVLRAEAEQVLGRIIEDQAAVGLLNNLGLNPLLHSVGESRKCQLPELAFLL